jgi:hypothetical protein
MALAVEGISFLEHRASTLVVAIQPEGPQAIRYFLFRKDPKGIGCLKV